MKHIVYNIWRSIFDIFLSHVHLKNIKKFMFIMDIKMRKKNLKQKYVCIINMKKGVKPTI